MVLIAMMVIYQNLITVPMCNCFHDVILFSIPQTIVTK